MSTLPVTDSEHTLTCQVTFVRIDIPSELAASTRLLMAVNLADLNTNTNDGQSGLAMCTVMSAATYLIYREHTRTPRRTVHNKIHHRIKTYPTLIESH